MFRISTIVLSKPDRKSIRQWDKPPIIAGNDTFLAFDATKNTQFTKERNTLFFDLDPADRTVLKVTDYIGSNTYKNLEDILYLLNDPTFVVSAK